jgi:hypothetical protein
MRVASFIAAPFVGLAFILALPFVGTAVLIWTGIQAVRGKARIG